MHFAQDEDDEMVEAMYDEATDDVHYAEGAKSAGEDDNLDLDDIPADVRSIPNNICAPIHTMHSLMDGYFFGSEDSYDVGSYTVYWSPDAYSSDSCNNNLYTTLHWATQKPQKRRRPS